MTAFEAKKIAGSLAIFAAKAKAVKADAEGGIWRVTLPVQDHNGRDFRVYIWHPFRSKKIVLSDAGSMVLGIRELGTPQLKAIQSLLASYGLKLMEDKTVMEKTDRPIPLRMMSYLQAWCAVDGMFRAWEAVKKETRDALRSPERQRRDAEDLRSGS
jgi:hypothetical protein